MRHTLYIVYMSDRTSVAVSKNTLQKLYSAKFDLRVNTLEEAIEGLIEEHLQKQEVKA